MNCGKPNGEVSEEGMNQILICSWKTDIQVQKSKPFGTGETLTKTRKAIKVKLI